MQKFCFQFCIYSILKGEVMKVPKLMRTVLMNTSTDQLVCHQRQSWSPNKLFPHLPHQSSSVCVLTVLWVHSSLFNSVFPSGHAESFIDYVTSLPLFSLSVLCGWAGGAGSYDWLIIYSFEFFPYSLNLYCKLTLKHIKTYIQTQNTPGNHYTTQSLGIDHSATESTRQ